MSSDRFGYDRLMTFEVIDRPLPVRGIVVDSETGEPIDRATVDLLDAEDGGAISDLRQ